ncbi:MAG: hypothetical protein ACLTSX_13855 [Collinsella sp.]
MVKYREILRLTYLGISQENIAFSCGCARSTVQLIQKLAKSKGLEWPLPGEMDDAAIVEPCSTRRRRPAMTGSLAIIDHEWIEREMGKPGVTMTLLWSEYCVKATDHGADPFMYSAFCQRHRKWAQRKPHHLRISTAARPERCRSIGRWRAPRRIVDPGHRRDSQGPRVRGLPAVLLDDLRLALSKHGRGVLDRSGTSAPSASSAARRPSSCRTTARPASSRTR